MTRRGGREGGWPTIDISEAFQGRETADFGKGEDCVQLRLASGVLSLGWHGIPIFCLSPAWRFIWSLEMLQLILLGICSFPLFGGVQL